MVEAKWSGSYPSLCSGKWTLEVNGENISKKIPSELRTSYMNTYGTYVEWHFDEYYDEVWGEYQDGLKREDWIAENKEWLDTITTDHELQIEIFNAINAEDWRYSSCGGCI